ncbi:MAG: hypothetical protein E5X80_11480 [Mesorhizobium sp.]|uniref:hypothetical protein n=1 Tax=Mesorhizobium sp. TaxID=1871066 RepID=UPI00121DCCDA|nr:hypothetical protein [Mesorhizobium sp.]TIO54560.1 MAG: hypothetical protein E5X78_02545 [Mesorhizobium sp.]TIO62495.1 MAG: hypothetical protein E5X79_02145 [Mesorhizobium sp.]TJV65256.1 MAG: hypothetical protein E5X80_11480 [Mesorhizobium sp.]
MTIILHIGVHKTGTSALQAFLARNAALLLEHGVFYKPTAPEWPNHNPLAVAFMPGSTDHGPTRLAMTLAEAEGKTLLISSEMLCEPGVDLDLFLSCLEGHDVRIIAYIRHPSDIVISAFNEVVRHYDTHWTRPLNEQPFAYDPSQLDVLRRWLKVPNLTLAPYDRAQWVEGSLFRDFLTMIGVPDNGFDYSQVGGNESLPYALIEALRHVNIAHPSADQHRLLVELLRTIQSGPGEYPLTRENVRYCIDRMRDALPSYRPHFRPDFQEDFLFEQRHEPERGWFGLQRSAIATATGFLAKAAAFVLPALDAGLL